MPSKSRISLRTVEKRTTRSRAPAKKKKVVTFVPRLHSGESEDALDYMFKYKIGEGRRQLSVHGGFYNYGTTKCQNMFNGKGRCPQGRKCRFAHTSLEVLFHPLVYKTSRCDKPECKQGTACAWAHSEEDLRCLSSDWLRADPISISERRTINKKRAEKAERKKNRRVRLAQPIGSVRKVNAGESPQPSAAPASSAEMSVSSWSTGRGTPPSDKSGTAEAMSVSTSSVSPALKEEEEDCEVVEMKEKMFEGEVMVVTVEEKNMESPSLRGKDEGASGSSTEFELWYRSAFNCEFLSWMHYLKQFEAKELNDVDLLWDLYMESRRKKSGDFSDLLAKEMTMVDETARALFVQRLCEWKSPVDIRGWLARVVGLPEYADLFVSSLGTSGRVDDLVHLGVDGDDLAEMGVSLVGHRMKILHHLKKFGEFDL